MEPNAYFWASFARVVQKAFPKKQLSQKDDLAKRVHQFRYLISAQQAQWVRDHYRKKGQTDRDALVAYLASKYNKEEAKDEFGLDNYRYFVDYDLEESSRLHNKAASLPGQSGSIVMLYPDFEPVVNIKIVMGFHTEFILASNGRFANDRFKFGDGVLLRSSSSAVTTTTVVRMGVSCRVCHQRRVIADFGRICAHSF